MEIIIICVSMIFYMFMYQDIIKLKFEIMWKTMK